MCFIVGSSSLLLSCLEAPPPSSKDDDMAEEEEEEEEESHAKWEMDLTALFPLLVWESVNLVGNNI